MKTQEKNNEMLHPHVSVDCVLLGFEEERLCVLLAERANAPGGSSDFKLPGDLIYEQEDLDDAAYRILTETTGTKRIRLKQFRCFGSPVRTSNPEDVVWLENSLGLKVERLITIAYLSLCKIGKKKPVSMRNKVTHWFPIEELPKNLPFDHNLIINEAVLEIRHWMDTDPSLVFEFLPVKFTAYQLRRIYEIIYDRAFDVRNFHKKLSTLYYVVATDDWEEGVSHRAARFYRFDKVRYNQLRSRPNTY